MSWLFQAPIQCAAKSSAEVRDASFINMRWFKWRQVERALWGGSWCRRKITKSAAIGYSSDDWTWLDLPKRRY
jgi:hypothetical protein